jgi:peptide/nickel transport system permease protein
MTSMSSESAVRQLQLAPDRRSPAAARSRNYWTNVRGRLIRDRAAVICGSILMLMLLAIVFADLLSPHDPYTGSPLRRLKPIGFAGHLLGTDELGRDMLSRLLHGGRLSWMLGIIPVVVATVIGTTLGIVAGYFGGALNMLMMRTTDVFYAFPSVLLAVAISGTLGPGINNAIISLTVVFIPPIIRISESVTTGVRNLDYVEAARASGASSFRIIRVQVLPNVLGPIFVYATGLLSICMILSAGLSFLGLGARPPQAEWGFMLNTLRTAVYTQSMVTVLPGVCIFITSICFNLMSDALRSAMDIREN